MEKMAKARGILSSGGASRPSPDRQLLLDLMERESKTISQIALEFHQADRNDENAAIRYSESIVAAADRVLSAGDWDSSLFLKTIVKPIKEMKRDAEHFLRSLRAEVDDAEGLVIPEHQVMLYVSLFQTRGDDLRSWEKQVRSLNRYIVGRPIYASEDNVKKVIRLKQNSSNEAYVVLLVDKRFVQKPNAFEVERKDRYGNSLETLRPGVLKSDNIIKLVHDGVSYRFVGGRLVED